MIISNQKLFQDCTMSKTLRNPSIIYSYLTFCWHTTHHIHKYLSGGKWKLKFKAHWVHEFHSCSALTLPCHVKTWNVITFYWRIVPAFQSLGWEANLGSGRWLLSSIKYCYFPWMGFWCIVDNVNVTFPYYILTNTNSGLELVGGVRHCKCKVLGSAQALTPRFLHLWCTSH